MIGLAALALALTVGGPDYFQAFARAKLYEPDPATRRFVEQVLLPRIQPEINRVANACAKRLKPEADVQFTVVISYKDSKPDAVLLDAEAPFGRCMAEGLAEVAYPAGPPQPDFAEDLEFTMHFHK